MKGHHTDNEIFNNSDFMEDMLKNQKKIMFSGAEVSHQNGAVERASGIFGYDHVDAQCA